jgi:hypothetical protein
VPLTRVIQDRVDVNGSLVNRTTLQSAVTSAEVALLARVTGRAYGFKSGEGGQLLRLQPERIFKDSFRRQPEYYLFFPVGNFRVGNKAFCKRDDSYPTPPEVGEEVLVFVLKSFRMDEQYLDIVDGGGIITIKKDGSFSLPPSYDRASENVSRASELIRRVGALVQEAPQ